MTNPNDPATTLTKREWFAARAMQGLLNDRAKMTDAVVISTLAAGMADILIAELNKPTEAK